MNDTYKASEGGGAGGADAVGVPPEPGEAERGEAERGEADVVEVDVVEVDDGDLVDGSGPSDVADVTDVVDDPLSVASAERDEYLDSLRRLQAEFENYRKRVAKQQTEQAERMAAALIDKLLPVLDALDLAATHLGDAESDDGRALVAASALLNDVLAKEGLERIDPAGDAFDPNAHEAVGHLPPDDASTAGTSPDGEASGAAPGGPLVAQVMRAGYRWRGAVVRPAMVMVRG